MADEVVGAVSSQQTITGDVGGSQVDQVGAEGAMAPEPLDPIFVSRASEYNMTEADLRAVPREVVERMLAGADRRTIEAYRRDQQNYDQQNQQADYSPQQNVQPNTQAQPPMFTPYDLKFDPEAEVAEPIVKNLSALNAHYAEQLKKMHEFYGQKFQGVERFAAQQQRQQDYAVLDRYIEGQGPEWSGVFGKGSTLEMDSRSQEFSKRDELRTAAIGMMQVSRMNGRPLPVQEALRRAQYAIFSEKAFAIERAKANGKRTQLESGATDRPQTPGGVPTPLTIKDKARLMREAAMRA